MNSIILTQNTTRYLDDYRKIDSEYQVYNKLKEECRKEIITKIFCENYGNILTDSGIIVASFVQRERKSFDAAKLKKDYPDLANQYVSKTRYGQFNILKG